jgi:formylglycine-generating enzyme required for sulfatase activity
LGTGQTCTAIRETNSEDCTGYRLPTEAEWEYVYRAGRTTQLYTGQDLTAGSCQNPPVIPAENPWGLFNMADGLEEFTHDYYYTVAGGGPGTHTVKGLGVEDVRAAARRGGGASGLDYNASTRCVRSL